MRTDHKPCAVFGADDVDPECTSEEFEAEEESEVIPKLPTPEMPTRSESLDHCVTHYPHRSWCKHCVEGRCRESAQITRYRGKRSADGVFRLCICRR